MRGKGVVVLLLLLLTACEVPNYSQNVTQELTYTKDPRTGLCFASRYLDTHYAVLTNIPCTAEVEKLLVKGKER